MTQPAPPRDRADSRESGRSHRAIEREQQLAGSASVDGIGGREAQHRAVGERRRFVDDPAVPAHRDVVAGRKEGRADAGDITLFFSGAIAPEYVAVAGAVYRKARERNVGVELPQERDAEIPSSLYVKKRSPS